MHIVGRRLANCREAQVEACPVGKDVSAWLDFPHPHCVTVTTLPCLSDTHQSLMELRRFGGCTGFGPLFFD